MLVVVNPHATTVSKPLQTVVLRALESRYAVDAVETQGPGQATAVCREAAGAGYGVVVAFGGDGTVNEAANGLAGTDLPLACLPGGATNVFARLLGMPADVIGGTDRLLAIAVDFRPRRVDTGRVEGRHFVFASGVGLDASVVARVERHPGRKARFRQHYFAWSAVATLCRDYSFDPPRLAVEAEGELLDGVTAVVQNADPFTFFGRRPIRVCRGAGLDTGSLSLAVLRRATPLDAITIVPRLFRGSAAGHRQVAGVPAMARARIRSLDGRPFPLEVDGDHIADRHEVEYEAAPRALAVVH